MQHYCFRGMVIHWKTLCIVEGIFRFLQDFWFVIAVFVVILGDQVTCAERKYRIELPFFKII